MILKRLIMLIKSSPDVGIGPCRVKRGHKMRRTGCIQHKWFASAPTGNTQLQQALPGKQTSAAVLLLETCD